MPTVSTIDKVDNLIVITYDDGTTTRKTLTLEQLVPSVPPSGSTEIEDIYINSAGYLVIQHNSSTLTINPSSIGAVGISGAPVANDVPRFTDANTIEGLSYSELLAALSGQAGAAFNWNLQDLDNVRFIDSHTVTITEGDLIITNRGEPIQITSNTYMVFSGQVSSDTAANAVIFRGKRSRGTIAAPTAVQANDVIMHVDSRPYDNAGFDVGAAIKFLATQTHTATAHGQKICFYTVDDDSVSQTLRLTINADGTIAVGGNAITGHAQAITDNAMLTVDGSPNSGEYGKWTANGLDGRTTTEVVTDLALSSLNAQGVVVASDASAYIIAYATKLQTAGANVQICDGTADDVQIQAVTDAITTGKVLCIGTTFNLSSTVNLTTGPKSLEFEPGSTINYSGVGSALIVGTVGEDVGITLKFDTLLGRSDNTSACGIELRGGSKHIIEGNHIGHYVNPWEDQFIRGVWFNTASAVDILTCSRVKINTIYGGQYGIDFEADSVTNMQGCVIDVNGLVGQSVLSARIGTDGESGVYWNYFLLGLDAAGVGVTCPIALNCYDSNNTIITHSIVGYSDGGGWINFASGTSGNLFVCGTDISGHIVDSGANTIIGRQATENAHITVFPFHYDSVVQGSWAFTAQSAEWGGHVYQNSSNADGDGLDFKVVLDVGTYTLRIMSWDTNNSPITQFLLDGVEIASFDLYVASPASNQLHSQTSISVTVPGIHTLRMKANGKNGSSGGYNMLVMSIGIWRTA